MTTEDGRTFDGAAADRRRRHPLAHARAIVRRRRSAAQRLHGVFAPSCRWPRSRADVQRDVVALWAGPGFHIVHYPLRHGTLFNIVAVFRRSAQSERGDVAAYRAELEHAYRDAHPDDEGAAGDARPRPAPGGRRPRSDPALAQGPRGAARRCRASDLAIAGAGRLHGDRGRVVPGRLPRRRRRRPRGGVPALRSARGRCAPRASRVEVALPLGRLSRRRHRRDVYWQMLGERSEADTFQCLAWLYDGFKLPDNDFGKAA